MRESKDQMTLDHEWEIPEGAIDGLNEMIKEEDSGLERGQMNRGGSGLYLVKSLPMFNSEIRCSDLLWLDPLFWLVWF